jgi:eukaryotic-like serine/threonine-protein kinase
VEVVGKFQILDLLGSGGMGRVYRARDKVLGRTVALKLLSAELANNQQWINRFVHEARAASAISHPNIAHIYEFGEENSSYFIAMEYVDGQTLRKSISGRELEIKDAISISVQLADALSVAHAAGIVHRDIKPENIIVQSGNHIKILDFGIAKLSPTKELDSTAPTLVETTPGTLLGTVDYMSPEQARGLEVDFGSDLWSLGVVFYEMIAGSLPFKSDTLVDTIASILNRAPVPLTTLVPAIDSDLEQLINRTLEKRREKRLASASIFRDELLRIQTAKNYETSKTRHSTQGRTYRRKRKESVNSIAILPLQNLSGDTESEYLSDGITETIINSLSQSTILKVMAASTVFRYKSRQMSPVQVGKELGVKFVLTGRLQQRGEKLLVSVELVNVKDGSQLWGQRYNFSSSALIEMQEIISREIFEQLSTRLMNENRGRLTKRYTEDSEAYQLYLKGRYYWNKRSPEGIKRSITFYDRAIERDPGYALAYAGLADSYALLSGFISVLPPSTALPKAKAAAMRAIELDENLAEAHASLALAKMRFDRDWNGAESEFRRAIELNPNYATAHHWYSVFLRALGRFDEAISEARKAQELDPLSLIINIDVGLGYYYAGRYEEAIAQYKNTIEIDNSFAQSFICLGWAYVEMELYTEAFECYRKAEEILGSSLPVEIGHLYACTGRRDEALRLLEEIENEAKQRYMPPSDLSVIYCALRRNSDAIRCLQKAFEENDPGIIWVKVDPMLKPLGDEEEYKELLRLIGLD